MKKTIQRGLRRAMAVMATATTIFGAAAATATSSSPGYLDCDGTRYMRIPNHSAFNIPASGSRTVTFDVMIASWASSSCYYGFVTNNYKQSSSLRTGLEVFCGSSSSQSAGVNFSTRAGQNFGGQFVSGAITPGTTAHVAITYNGSTGVYNMYVNGSSVRTGTNSTPSVDIPSLADILVGARYTVNSSESESHVDSQGNLVGRIDNLRFYDYCLSAAEVSQAQTGAVSGKEPFAAYDFENLTGTNCPDITGNGHDGVLVGFPDYSLSGSVVTTETPAPGTGTIEVYNGATKLSADARAADGTELTVVVTPALDYEVEGIYVNGEKISGNTFVVSGDMTVSVVFVRAAGAPTKVLVWDRDEDGSRYYRIPAIEVAADGSLVALCDKRGDSNNDLPNTISVVAKRSTDGGQTWSKAVVVAQGDQSTGKTYGDPAIVLDRTTGNLVAVYAGDTGFFYSTKTNRAGFYVSISEDNGQTWSEPRSITNQVYQSTWYGAFAASGSMLQTKDGTIMFVANTRLSSVWAVTDVYEFVCASRDGGQTWSVLNPDSRIPSDGIGNESKLVELADGSLIMSIRSAGARRFSRSTDGGRTWSTETTITDLVEPNCNGDIISYPSTDGISRLLHSLPANASTRRDVSVYMSVDGGNTWPVCKQLVDAEAAYSSLTVLPDGTIGCLLEEGNNEGFRIYYMNFSLDWLSKEEPADAENDVFDGTLNCDGSRYMYINHSGDFDIAAGASMTVTAKVNLKEYGAHRGIICNRAHSATSSSTGNGSTTGFDLFGGNSSSQSFSNNVNLNKGSWNNLGHPWCNTLATEQWDHVAWVLDGSAGTSKLYINGELKDTRTNSDIRSYAINPQFDMLVGARYSLSAYPCAVDASSYWLGQIDDVRFYSKAMTAAEVVADGSATVGSSTQNLIAAYDFSEVNGNEVADISGNGHTGYLVGFPQNVSQQLLWLSSTNGHIEVWSGVGEDGSPAGFKIEDGYAIPSYLTSLYVRFVPNDGYQLVNASGVIGGNGAVVEPIIQEDGSYVWVVDRRAVTGDLQLSAVFDLKTVGIDGVESDDNNAPIEYFNLQGVKMSGKNLVPGVYVKRQGGSVKKVIVAE